MLGTTRTLARTAAFGLPMRLRAACWLALVSGVLGAALFWLSARAPVLWSLSLAAPYPFAIALPLLGALVTGVTVVCVVVGVAARARGGSGRSWLLLGISLAGVVLLLILLQRMLTGAFAFVLSAALSDAVNLGFLVAVVLACALAVSSGPATIVTGPSPADREAPDAAVLVRFAIGGAFVVLAIAVLVTARALIVPDPFGLGPEELLMSAMMIPAMTLPLFGAIAAGRGSAFGRQLVSVVAVVLVLDGVDGFVEFRFSASAFAAVGYGILTVIALLVAVVLWLPPVSRSLAVARAQRPAL
ncbi:hypothetical protein [Leifsonia poae]|uniref:hypothetical protein n=1 Tax=Leifsonia poae TaxID=110933 RepID=UPI001CBAF87B|nr:hypothetical protein [Leifsonia poae]